MSDHIPFELQFEIMKTLPVKSLIRFRSVSKAWKSLIDSSDFIAAHSRSVRHTHSERLLVRYEGPVESECKYDCIVDDDTFPRQKFALTVPSSFEFLKDTIILVSCQGLLCLCGSYKEKDDSFYDMVVLWNPSIRKSVAISLPKYVSENPSSTALGFGVCPVTSDPKIIYMCKFYELGSSVSSSWQVKVFTLSSGSWRRLSSKPKSIDFEISEIVVIDKFIYWLVCDEIDIHRTCNLIMSFDLGSDEFREISLPDSLAHELASDLSIFKIWESLAVIDCVCYACPESYDVWMMEYGVPESFVKLFSINVTDPSALCCIVHEFRKTGEPILELQLDECYFEPVVLARYELYSGDVKDIGTYESMTSFGLKSYTETLLLLNESKFSSYLGVDEAEDDDN